MVCESLRKHGIKATLDVHLMVEPVDALAQAFAKAGANIITFHPEATRHVDRSLQAIRAAATAVFHCRRHAHPAGECWFSDDGSDACGDVLAVATERDRRREGAATIRSVLDEPS